MFVDTRVVFRVRPRIDNAAMDELRGQGFESHVPGHDWAAQLERSLLWIGAFHRDRLVGFVNVAWDDGVHAFLLDTAVAADLRRRGIGTRLVREAIAATRRHGGIEWLHVDSDEDLIRDFYLPAGFEPTHAGVVRVGDAPMPSSYTHTDVRREGDVVVRSAGPWASTVHALLRHLEAVGFDGAPRVIDAQPGREVLTYIEGEISHRGQRTIEAAAGVGDLLRRLHDATASCVPPSEAVWHPSLIREVEGDERVISHCDTGPWNIVLRDGIPFALIDWDMAGPVDVRAELAEAAMLNANLFSDDVVELNQLPDFAYRCRQLSALVDAYGLSRRQRDGLVDMMIEHIVRSMAGDTYEANVMPETKESDALWGLTWQARQAAWLLRNRPALERALT